MQGAETGQSAGRTHLLFIVGPTACGKSDFAVELAEQVGRNMGRLPEIINFDSVQFYEGVDIGAAKPSAHLLARVPHHLVGHVPLNETYTAGNFRRDALKVIDAAAVSGQRLLFPVGGSGFHMQALEKGMYQVPEIPLALRESLQKRASDGELAELHAELSRLDPESGLKIKANDSYRILRALEILLAAPGGGTLGDIRAKFIAEQPPATFSVSVVGLFRPRDILRKRVEERTRLMFKAGLVDEVVELRRRGHAASAALQSVGYKEVGAFLDGNLQQVELQPWIVTHTMQLAKRQMTWFKRDPRITWFDAEKGWKDPLEKVQEILTAAPQKNALP
jgi:tRNA dimethylallyltransferase